MPNLVGAKSGQYAKKHVTVTVNEDSTRLISNLCCKSASQDASSNLLRLSAVLQKEPPIRVLVCLLVWNLAFFNF